MHGRISKGSHFYCILFAAVRVDCSLKTAHWVQLPATMKESVVLWSDAARFCQTGAIREVWTSPFVCVKRMCRNLSPQNFVTVTFSVVAVTSSGNSTLLLEASTCMVYLLGLWFHNICVAGTMCNLSGVALRSFRNDYWCNFCAYGPLHCIIDVHFVYACQKWKHDWCQPPCSVKQPGDMSWSSFEF